MSEARKLTKSEGGYVDSAANAIMSAFVMKDQIALNAASIRAAAGSAYDMALVMLDARKERIEIDEDRPAALLKNENEKCRCRENEQKEEEEKKKKEKKASKRKASGKKKTSDAPKKRVPRLTPDYEYNVKPLLEAATEVTSGESV